MCVRVCEGGWERQGSKRGMTRTRGRYHRTQPPFLIAQFLSLYSPYLLRRVDLSAGKGSLSVLAVFLFCCVFGVCLYAWCLGESDSFPFCFTSFTLCLGSPLLFLVLIIIRLVVYECLLPLATDWMAFRASSTIFPL